MKEKRQQLSIEQVKDFAMMNLGSLLLAVGIYFFKFPNNFTTGGVSGLSVILSAMPIPFSSGTIMFAINMLFLVMGFLLLGKEMGVKTVYCTLVFSITIQILELTYPMVAPFTDQKMLELAFSIILPGIGSAILFTLGACSGGTDILALIIRKHTNIELGSSLLVSDFFITFSTLFFFGIETCLYSMLGLILKSFVIDNVIENISTKKIVIVISTKQTEIVDYVTHTLHRGVTKWDCFGGFTGSQKTAIMTALTRAQARNLRLFVKSVDSSAFIIVNSSTEVIGKGFYRSR